MCVGGGAGALNCSWNKAAPSVRFKDESSVQRAISPIIGTSRGGEGLPVPVGGAV